jgi:hypothetical protein
MNRQQLEEIRKKTASTYQPFKPYKSEQEQPLWQKAIDYALRPQRAVTTGLANITDKDSNTTFLGGVGAGLSGKGVDFDEVMNNLGWEQNEQDEEYSFLKGRKGSFDLFDIVNLAGNIGLDPLTYLTFGGGSLLKEGARATAKEAIRQAAKHGVEASGSALTKGGAKRLTREVPDLIEASLLKKGMSVEDVVKQKKSIVAEIENAGKAARLKAQNARFNFDVPFTNISKSFGKKGNLLRVTDRTITPEMVTGTLNMLSKVSKNEITPDDIQTLLTKRYGKDDIRNLTMQEVNDLQQLSKLDYDPAKSSFLDQATDLLGDFKFQQGSGGVSKIGSTLTKYNPFYARTVYANENPTIQRSANFYQDTKNRIIGRVRQVEKDLENIIKMRKDVTDEEMRLIPYIIEKSFPKEYGNLDTMLNAVSGSNKNKKKLEDLAEYMKARMGVYGQQEVDVGLRESVIENYFPHIQDFDALESAGLREAIKEFRNDPTIGRFIQQSLKNPYAKARTSFKTIAEVDDKIAELKSAIISLTPGTEEYLKMERQIQTLEMLFKRNPIEVFEKRSKTAIRSAAMKALMGQYELDGIIIRNVKELTQEQVNAGFRVLRPEEVDAIGLANVAKKGKGERIAIHEKLYNLLSESTRYSSKESINQSLELINAATNVFKTLYTSLVPKHYFYNLVGSVFNNTMAGVTADAYVKAGKILTKIKKQTLTPREQKLVDFALDNGILNQTAFADLVRPEILMRGRTMDTAIDNPGFYRGIDKFNQTIVDNTASKKLRKYVGDPTDNITRLAHYIHIYETTRSVKLAAESVRLHLFNYNELTNADRMMKVVFPFWNWMKNNIPLQLHKFVTEPRIAQQWQRLQQESFGEDDAGNYPKYIQEGFFKLSSEDNAFYNPRTPVQDLSQLDNVYKMFLNALTPVAKIPTELYFNEQVFSENPISYQKMYTPQESYLYGEQGRSEIGKYLLNNLGIFGDIPDTVAKLADKEQDKSWVDILNDQLFGSTTYIK